MTREEAFIEINKTQDEYVKELIDLINDPSYEMVKTVNFTSPTGTGKTKMMSKFINRLPDYFFVVTTLSKGQLHLQVRESLKEDCENDNFIVYGSADYKINSKLDAEDIIRQIPDSNKCIWIRDEGHIKTNRFDEILSKRCFKVVNFSATNTTSDIKCNFTHTMMLRTVHQTNGTTEDAILKLLEIKKAHKDVKGYNPCAIFRCIAGNDDLHAEIVGLCEKYNLKYIDLNDDPYVMAKLCEDDNENDVIINKFKLNEGIDIRRAHSLWLSSSPANASTTIQAIGRCRRNALLYRNDIDILAPENKKLLEETRQCFVFYNNDGYKIDEDPDGELQYAFCDKISCEELKPNSTIHVDNGQLANGLYILELEGETGDFEITVDEETGFNIVNPINNFYDEKQEKNDFYFYFWNFKVSAEDIVKFPIQIQKRFYDEESNILPNSNEKHSYEYRNVSGDEVEKDVPCKISEEVIDLFLMLSKKYTRAYIYSKIIGKDIQSKADKLRIDIKKIKKFLKEETDYCEKNKGISGRGRISDAQAYSRTVLDILSIDKTDVYDAEYEAYFTQPLSKIFTKNEILFIKYFFIQGIKEDKHKFSYKSNYLLEAEYKKHLKNCAKNIEKYKDLPKHEEITYFILENDIKTIYKGFHFALKVQYDFSETINISKDHIYRYFEIIDELLDGVNSKPGEMQLSASYCNQTIQEYIQKTLANLNSGKVDFAKCDFSVLQKPLTEAEKYLVEKKFYHRYGYYIPQKEIENALKKAKKPYIKTLNDKESAIIGTDLMRPIKDFDGNIIWTESKTVSSKMGGYNKFNRFISQKYENELKKGKEQLFTGKNDFPFDKRCNSMVGYCVEYYSKYLIYGKTYLSDYINDYTYTHNKKLKYLIVRACMQKYKELMVECYGMGVSKFIKITSEEQLLSGKYDEFVDVVTTLGERTANFVRYALYANRTPENNIDPNLSIEHISGLADYITEDTILDVKVRNNIDDKCVRQVLAYHYLSTKRSDLHIKKVIIYDATSDRAVEIDISKENQV